MVSPAQMQDSDGDGDSDDSRPQIGSVGFIIGTRSLCVYTPLGWIDVEVMYTSDPTPLCSGRTPAFSNLTQYLC